MSDMASYFCGKEVYGDDLDDSGIIKWFEEEAEGYFELSNSNGKDYNYHYHALNYAHAYSYVAGKAFARCLAIGCARGDEILPVAKNIRSVVALEPAEGWQSDMIGDTPAKYIKPNASGKIPLEDSSVDLITCFGVLHHIPNVTTVVKEMSRVLESGGFLLLREPSSSMGDWRNPRRGLTKNERGLPSKWLENTLNTNSFEIIKISPCMFPITDRIGKIMNITTYNSRILVLLDDIISRIFKWNNHYHRDSFFKKLAPGSTFYVTRKM